MTHINLCDNISTVVRESVCGAPLAQQVERRLGKAEVDSSNLLGSSKDHLWMVFFLQFDKNHS